MEQTSSLIVNPPRAGNFVMFRKLPAELRIKVWQFAMPEARTVVIKSPHSRKTLPVSLDKVLPQALDSGETWQSTTPVPALLHVNGEARHEALKHYSLSLGVGDAQPRVYIDFKRDTLFFGDAELTPECSQLWTKTKDFEKVRRLAIVPEGAWRALQWTKDVDLNLLQTLIFVHGTESIKPGCLSQLMEDEISVATLSFQLGLDQQVQQLETAVTDTEHEIENPMKQRLQAAREEVKTLEMVLPERFEKELVVSTAVFKEIRA
ncbi:hypothetical protein F5Y09DRAFT_348148 [Xylaria sp. FL1042]|nr:hypothetical protein F5Y09DRAFT_348148 [Xylaria sp. FL1042]